MNVTRLLTTLIILLFGTLLLVACGSSSPSEAITAVQAEEEIAIDAEADDHAEEPDTQAEVDDHAEDEDDHAEDEDDHAEDEDDHAEDEDDHAEDEDDHAEEADDHGDEDEHAAGSSPVEGAREIRVVATEFAFEPNVITLHEGEPVNIVLINEGSLPHELQIEAFGFHAHAEAGETVTVGFVPDETTELEFSCLIAGHYENGMFGNLTVENG